MATSPSSRGPAVDMNVTPMLDVLLVLFVTLFLLNLNPPKPHINVQVPPPSGGGGGSQLVLQLPDAGGFVLNGQPVPGGTLDEVIRAAFQDRPVKLLFVGAGGQRRYEEVVEAVDRAKGAGVQVVAFLP